MRFCPLLFFLFSVFFISCQKDYSLEPAEKLEPVQGKLLKAATLKDAISDLSISYEYNSSDLPVKTVFSNAGAGFTAVGFIEATRDVAGKPNSSVVIQGSNLSSGHDTIRYEINRNTAGRVTYVLLKSAGSNNTTGCDSLIYAYDATGKLSGYLVYTIENGTGFFKPKQAFELTYNGSNVVKTMEYELPGALTPRKLLEITTYFYDNKPAARPLTEDDFIAKLAPVNNLVPSVNNCLKYTRENAVDSDKNIITEYKYSYGASGKPVSAQITTIRPEIPDSQATLTFTYQ